MPGNAPLDPNLHPVQDAIHAAHKTGQKAHNGAVALSQKQTTPRKVSALEHQKLNAPPPEIAKHLKTSDESGEDKPGEL